MSHDSCDNTDCIGGQLVSNSAKAPLWIGQKCSIATNIHGLGWVNLNDIFFILFFELVIESSCSSVCVCVCLLAPSRNTHFRRSCRPLVEDRVPNIGLG